VHADDAAVLFDQVGNLGVGRGHGAALDGGEHHGEGEPRVVGLRVVVAEAAPVPGRFEWSLTRLLGPADAVVQAEGASPGQEIVQPQAAVDEGFAERAALDGVQE